MRVAVNTPQFRMADRMAGGNLTAIIIAGDASGLSAEEISRRLFADHGAEVSGQTIRQWLPRLKAETEAAAS